MDPLKKEFLILRSTIASLKKMRPGDSWEGFGFPVRPGWAIRKLTPRLSQVSRELHERADVMLIEKKPLIAIAQSTGLPIRRVKLLSQKLQSSRQMLIEHYLRTSNIRLAPR